MQKPNAFLPSFLLLCQGISAQQQSSSQPQSTITIQLYDPAPEAPLSAYILSAHDSTTTMQLLCDPNSTAAGCGDLLSNNYTFSPNRLLVQAALGDQFTYTEDCSTAPGTAICRYSESADTVFFLSTTLSATNFMSTTSTATDYTTSLTFTAQGTNITMLTVPIVSRIEKLPPKTTTSSAAVITRSTTSSSSTAQAASATSTSPQPTETMSGRAARLSPFGVFGPLCAIFVFVW